MTDRMEKVTFDSGYVSASRALAPDRPIQPAIQSTALLKERKTFLTCKASAQAVAVATTCGGPISAGNLIPCTLKHSPCRRRASNLATNNSVPSRSRLARTGESTFCSRLTLGASRSASPVSFSSLRRTYRMPTAIPSRRLRAPCAAQYFVQMASQPSELMSQFLLRTEPPSPS
jgi:hypothetical protein